MARNQAYMPIFESFNSATADGHDDSAEESDGPAAAARTGTGLTTPAAGPSKVQRTSRPALEETDDKRKRASGKGKRKIAIEYIKDKKSRAVTFSKRKAGIFAKARELSTLTGSSILLLVVSESGVVYTYTTEKFQPMVTQDVGKNMIAACLSGKVNLDDRFSSHLGASSRAGAASSELPKRGGDILLKDVFTSHSPSTSALTTTDKRPEDSSISASSSIYLPNTSQYQLAETPLPPLPVSYLPSLSHTREHMQPPSNPAEPSLVKVPRLRSKRTRDHEDNSGGNIDEISMSSDPYMHRMDVQGISGHEERDNEDDLSDGECEARMRQIRRSLSIERRFEKVEEEERPRLLRASDCGTGTDSANGMDDYGMQNGHQTAFDSIARRKEGWSFTAAEDAWSSFKDRFHLPASNASTTSADAHTSINHLNQYNSAIPVRYGTSYGEPSDQGNQRVQPANSNTRSRTAQMVVLPELPRP